jgi:hypothetical protein
MELPSNKNNGKGIYFLYVMVLAATLKKAFIILIDLEDRDPHGIQIQGPTGPGGSYNWKEG